MSRIVDPILAELDREASATRRLLERVPPEKLAWKPHPKSMSLGHHRGQLTVYLRLLDVALPVTYGRSADERS